MPIVALTSLKNIYNFPTLTEGLWQSIHYYFCSISEPYAVVKWCQITK